MRNIKMYRAVPALLVLFSAFAAARASDGGEGSGAVPDGGVPDAGPLQTKKAVLPKCQFRDGPGPFKAKFGAGEMLRYLVTLKDVPVGKASLTTEAVKKSDGKRVVLTKARGRTNSFFSKVHPLSAVVEEETVLPRLLPLTFMEDLTDMGRRRKTVQTFIRPDGDVEYEFDYFGRRDSERYRAKAGPHVHDFISALYNVRTMALRDGDGICMDVLYYKHVWRLHGSVKGRERIQTHAGFFDAIVLEGVAILTSDPSKQRPVKVWLTDDQYRLPIKAASVVNTGETEICATFVRKAGEAQGKGLEPGSDSDWWGEGEREQ